MKKLEMELNIGKFEFEVMGKNGIYDIDPVTNEERDLLYENVAVAISLKGSGLEFDNEYYDFVRVRDYERLIGDLKNTVEKPDFYKIQVSPGIEILSVPGIYNGDEDIDEKAIDELVPEEMSNDPAIALILHLHDGHGYTHSTVQIILDKEEIRQLVDYLEESTETVENTVITV